MLLNKQAVKQEVRANGKQCKKEFVDALDRKVAALIKSAAEKARGFARLTGSELL